MFLYQSPTAPKSTVVFRGKTTLPQARSTLEFVNKRLPPSNPEILRNIKNNITNKSEFDRTKFIEDVKSDPFILLNCARRLPNIIDQPQRYIDPLQALNEIEQDKIEELFRNPFPSSHEHRLEAMTKPQALTLKLTIACARYAEALSLKSSIAPSLAFSSALFRQLGLNLIAWNYPAIYSKALARHRAKGEDLHSELEKLLGISPRKLGVRLLQDWGIELPTAGEDSSKNEHLNQLAEICALCEDPENFPEAKNLFAQKESEIKNLIDPETLNNVKQSIETNFIRFIRVAPIISNITRRNISTEQVSPLFLSETILQRNPLLSRTNAEIKTTFAEVYSKLLNRTFSPDAVKLLVDKVVPSIGFSHGCLFLTNKKHANKLMPALRFGTLPLQAYSKLLEISNGMIRDSVDTLTAYRSDGIGVTGDLVTFILSGFNHLRHEGVLYLELAEDLREDPNFESSLLFQIVRQSLKDCFDGS